MIHTGILSPYFHRSRAVRQTVPGTRRRRVAELDSLLARGQSESRVCGEDVGVHTGGRCRQPSRGRTAEAGSGSRDAPPGTVYRNLFDPESGFFRPRNAAGTWVPDFNPALDGHGFVEGTGWHYATFAPEDMGWSRLRIKNQAPTRFSVFLQVKENDTPKVSHNPFKVESYKATGLPLPQTDCTSCFGRKTACGLTLPCC